MSIAICPGSFDPITLGHLNIIRRTARIFDEVVVVIMQNSTKKSPMFTVEERVEMVRKATERYKNVKVDSSDKTMKCFELKNIKNAKEVKEQLSQLVEEERQRKRISGREFMTDHDHDGYADDYDDEHYH